MGKRFLIDTNVLVDFQVRSLPQKGLDFVSEAIDDSFIISFVNYIEFLGYNHISESMESFIKLATVVEIDKNIINQTIKIRKETSLKLPDAIIAATAITNNYTLISRNYKDFKAIEGLDWINPHEL
ncbi:type II toxin-antitoxin system VapC family toxin [Mucilaginibacter conchicola]|uniref:Type II toxin-antitoxin system VapC family toxin n=1 Tax=Mucilaginibacter conchicola TaxID=2303333 RepID=A0A372NNL6_9SPHI|nr:type II toxin-antitoxin system VapC family toxin [Mucilaginibacter conchicola]RFZ90514.1 type II toxin-antitoxin system VapC family toxin [Mucilaginibacter conchicola]